MIDKEKIYRGMKTCLDSRVDDKTEREYMRDSLIAYTRAFYDAIGWYKKNLWHNVSETPEDGSPLLFLYRSNNGYEGYGVLCNYAKSPWGKVCKDYGIIKWAYISDTLTKDSIV